MRELKTIFCTLFLIYSGFSFAQTSDAEKFKIGVIAPLSGPLAEYGNSVKNGIELARALKPEKFTDIEFLYEDSQYSAGMALSAFGKLRTVNGVSLVINWGNPTTGALAPVAESSKTPLIGMTLEPKFALGKKYVLRAANADDEFSQLLAMYLEKHGFKNIGIVISDNGYVQGMYEGLKKSLGEKIQIEIVEQYNPAENDFRSSVSKIRSQEYDSIGVFLVSGQVSTFYRQLAEQKVSLPTFGTDIFESAAEIKEARGGMNGAVYANLDVNREFQKSYTEKYGNDFQISTAGNSHDIALLIGTQFNKTPNVTNNEIISRLRETDFHKGVCGNFRFVDDVNGGPHFSFPIKMKKIENLSTTKIHDG